MDSDFSKRLKAAVSAPGTGYHEMNLKQNPFMPMPELSAINNLMVDRSEVKDQLVLGVEDMLQGGCPTITLIGGKGIGKTHILLYFYLYLREAVRNNPRIEVRLIRATPDIISFKNYLLTQRDSDVTHILFIDEAEKKWAKCYDDIESLLEAGVKVIWAWNAQTWKSAKMSDIIPPKTTAVVVRNLPDEFLFGMVVTRLEYYKLEKKNPNPFDEEVLRKFVFMSRGRPYTLLSWCARILKFSMKEGAKGVSTDLMDKFFKDSNVSLETLTPEYALSMLRKITPAEMNVLEAIYASTTSYDRGTTITEIAGILKLTAPTVFFHVKNLVSKGILSRERAMKEVRYSIKGEFMGALEESLQKDDNNSM